MTGPSALSRRRLLTGAVGVALVGGACGRAGGNDDPDLDIAATAGALERLVTDTYTGTLDAVVQGRLGAAIPEVVVGLLHTGAGQHQAHLDAWNDLLASGGRPAVTEPTPRLKPLVDRAAGRAADIPAAATLVLRLEDYASRTYVQAVPVLRRPDTIRLASQILVVDHQRQAVLRWIVGLPSVAADFAPSDPEESRPATW